jgi:hypothetical protein
MKVFTDKQGKFYQGQIIPIKQPHPGGVILDPQKQIIKIIKDLTKADFPEVPIRISDDGWIRAGK